MWRIHITKERNVHFSPIGYSFKQFGSFDLDLRGFEFQLNLNSSKPYIFLNFIIFIKKGVLLYVPY